MEEASGFSQISYIKEEGKKVNRRRRK